MAQQVDTRSKADLEWWSDGVIAGGERLNAQRSTLNAQRSTLNAQRSTLNVQRLNTRSLKASKDWGMPSSARQVDTARAAFIVDAAEARFYWAGRWIRIVVASFL